MKKILPIIFVLITVHAFCQEDYTKQAQPIVEEGKQLYRSEMASWYGTDLFLKSFSDMEKIGGYFSYVKGDVAKCIFFSSSDPVEVIGTITFDATYDLEKAQVNLQNRSFTKNEKNLYTIRKNALAAINSDTLFKLYENTNLNIIPFIYKGEKKVYVLTGTQQYGTVIFGNDYLIMFNKNNQVVSKKSIHQNIMPISYGEQTDNEAIAAIHSHLPETGEFITATDICTLMLYHKFTGWKSYTVVSDKLMNIWDCEKNTLIVVSRDIFKNAPLDPESRISSELMKSMNSNKTDKEKGKKKKKSKRKRKNN